ncbi:MAG: hypothetical protein ACOX7R_11305 [Acetivibrionales bacterium]|jgi:hypothetical protein
MDYFSALENRVKDFFSEDRDELLFFILVFAYVFLSSTRDNNLDISESRDQENNSRLFFIVLLLLLFLNDSHIKLE